MRCLSTAAIAAALAALLGACGGGTADRTATAAERGWTTFDDARRGLSVSLPPGWHRARHNLTPGLIEPREILSVGTYPPRRDGGSRCHVPGCPTATLAGMRPTDVLVSIQERLDLPDQHFKLTSDAGFLARERPFELEPRPVDGSGPGGRCARRKLAWWAWTPFGEAGRGFYAFVAVGRDASRRTRREMRLVLDRLSFRPRPARDH
jgi:hypothetical protein